MSHRSRVRTPQGVAMVACYVGGPVGPGMFCYNILGGQRCQCSALAPESWSCTVAILAQGTSWAVAVTQAFFMCGGCRWQCVLGGCCWLLGAAVASGWSGAELARTHVLPFCVASCVRMSCLLRVLSCGGLSAAIRPVSWQRAIVGSRSQAGCLKRNTAMDDSIGGS